MARADAVLALHDHTHTQCLAHSHGDGRQRTVELSVASQRPHEQPVGNEGARLEVALAERAKKPEQRGWLSKGDLAMAERSMAVGTPKPSGGSSKPSSDFAGLVDEEGKAPDGGTVGGRTWMP